MLSSIEFTHSWRFSNNLAAVMGASVVLRAALNLICLCTQTTSDVEEYSEKNSPQQVKRQICGGLSRLNTCGEGMLSPISLGDRSDVSPNPLCIFLVGGFLKNILRVAYRQRDQFTQVNIFKHKVEKLLCILSHLEGRVSAHFPSGIGKKLPYEKVFQNIGEMNATFAPDVNSTNNYFLESLEAAID